MASLTATQFAEQMPDAGALLSDEPEMESSLHYQQLALLVSGLEWHWRERQDFFIGANLTVYYSHQQLRNRDFRGPDFFLVTGTERRQRPSWVVWEENGRYPDLIIELLSDTTAAVDRKEKKALYQQVFRTPEYFWFSPDSLEFVGFRLINNQYRAIRANARRHLWSSVLGMYLGIEPRSGRLRYFDGSGALIPTADESALQQQARAEQQQARAEQQQARAEQQQARAEQQQARAEQQQARAEQQQARAEQEHARAERLASRLRELGIDAATL